MTTRIYLDYNATTPIHPELLPFVHEQLSNFGNASSVHWAGRKAKKLVSFAREKFAAHVGVAPTEIVFTSGGSEANNQALKEALPLKPVDGRDEIFCSAVEHPSVMKPILSLTERGYRIFTIPVRRDGQMDLEFLQSRLSQRTALVSVQLVNNETGTIFPIKKIANLVHGVGGFFHSDMVQGLGKLKLNLKDLDVDFATFSAHKFYSLKGAGALFVKRGAHLAPLIDGGGQERSRRAGTENALAIGCWGRAIEILAPRLELENARVKSLRDLMEQEILKQNPSFAINGAGGERVPNTLSLTCPCYDGETLLINLDTGGVAISSGAACSSGAQEPSPVLRAMGLTLGEASQSMRISLGWLTTDNEVKIFLKIFSDALSRMREVRAGLECGAEAL